MPKYITKNRDINKEIYALQWTGEKHREMYNFLTNYTKLDSPIETSGECFEIDHSKVHGGLILKNGEIKHCVNIGQYVVKVIDDTFINIDAEIFENNYILADDQISDISDRDILSKLDKQRIENAIWTLMQYRDEIINRANSMKFDEYQFESAFKILGYIQANMEKDLGVDI